MVFLVGAGIGATSCSALGSAISAAASAPSAIEDPATLLPIALHAPLPKADEIFTSRILRFTIALDQAAKRGVVDAALRRGSSSRRPRPRWRDDDVREALGPRAATALQDVVTAARLAARAAPNDEPSVTAFEIATARLDNALIAAGLPYFVDASVIVDPMRSTRLLLLYEFSILSSSLYASGDARVRAVRLRRLDRLNWSHTLLGFVNPHRIYAVVLLDQIDEQLVTNILPALANDAPMPLLASEAPATAGGQADGAAAAEALAISARAGRSVRAEVDELLGADGAAGRELGEAVRARRALFEKWNERLKNRGSLKSPSKLELDVDALEREVGTALPRGNRGAPPPPEAPRAPDVLKAYAAVREAFVASVERHEVQHRLDQIRPTAMPKEIDALIPRGTGPAGENVRSHVKNELSAYLAQVARDEPLTKTTFTMLVRFLADPRVRGGAESYAALIATEQLAAELGITGIAPLLDDRKLDDARIGRRASRAHRATGSQAARSGAEGLGAPVRAPLQDLTRPRPRPRRRS